jgi:hypothetical protein
MIAFAHASQRLFSRAVAKALDLFSRLCDVMAEVRENRRKLKLSCSAIDITIRRKTTTIFRSCVEAFVVQITGEVPWTTNLPRRTALNPRSS